ncbi:type II toxin-antitoxin system VapC family toxin [Myxococcota bacterium]|nr:type II toxin-antitoxin system VapC family toxin [Myxococcota bacterium]
MRLLLDTHAFLWWCGDDPRLVPAAREAIRQSDADVWVSAASAWEIAIKAALGRLSLPGSVAEAAEASGFRQLPVSFAHAELVGELPPIHADPFDRLLIAQAQVEDLVLVTHDGMLLDYGIPILRT